jgi:ABC-type Fe3+-siderophore transport system permease subunit
VAPARVAAPLIIGGTLAILCGRARSTASCWARRRPRILGVDVKRERAILLALASLVTAAGVAVAGLIGFVGLVIPHLVRAARRAQRAPRAAPLRAVRREPARGRDVVARMLAACRAAS